MKDGLRTRAYDLAMRSLTRKRAVDLDAESGVITVVSGPGQGPDNTVGNKGWGFIEFLHRYEGYRYRVISTEELRQKRLDEKKKSDRRRKVKKRPS